ncbi:MAG: hypothetical protein ABI693_18305 [Bryobacteraceae bacterium]
MLPLFFLYVLVALVAVATLLQFFALKREIWREKTRVSREQVKLREDLTKLQLLLAETQSELEDQTASHGTSDNAAMNYTRRTRVLRLHRRGDRPDQIAATLHLPQNEVALLVKLQQLGGGPVA